MKLVEVFYDKLEFELYKLGDGTTITLPKNLEQARKKWNEVKQAMDVILAESA